MHDCNPNTQEVDAERLEFKTTLNYVVTLYFNIVTKGKKLKTMTLKL